MSKEAALRAMREARYNAMSARSASTSKPDQPAKDAEKPAKPAARPSKKPASAPEPAATATEELCGHRSMNGRTCTRERGHAAKSHRYS